MLLEKILKNMNNNSIAYKNDVAEYTYKEIYSKIKQIYAYLNSKSDCKRVLVVGNKEVDMISVFLGSAAAGITYIPIDAFMPEDRIHNIIKDCKPQLIITMEDKEFLCSSIEQVCVKNIYQKGLELDDIVIKTKKEDIYYIIYTSGSSGKPKGVQITYKNLETFILWLVDKLGNKETKVLNQASFSFDLSVLDIYYSLFTGSQLIAINTKNEYTRILYDIINSNAEMAVFTPSFAELLLLDQKFSKNNLTTLNEIIFCGETLRTDVVRRIKERFQNIKVINSYGPTETTVAVCMTEITDDMMKQNDLPIGEYIENSINIVDKNRQTLPETKIGEILILGDMVSPRLFRK